MFFRQNLEEAKDDYYRRVDSSASVMEEPEPLSSASDQTEESMISDSDISHENCGHAWVRKEDHYAKLPIGLVLMAASIYLTNFVKVQIDHANLFVQGLAKMFLFTLALFPSLLSPDTNTRSYMTFFIGLIYHDMGMALVFKGFQ